MWGNPNGFKILWCKIFDFKIWEGISWDLLLLKSIQWKSRSQPWNGQEKWETSHKVTPSLLPTATAKSGSTVQVPTRKGNRAKWSSRRRGGGATSPRTSLWPSPPASRSVPSLSLTHTHSLPERSWRVLSLTSLAPTARRRPMCARSAAPRAPGAEPATPTASGSDSSAAAGQPPRRRRRRRRPVCR